MVRNGSASITVTSLPFPSLYFGRERCDGVASSSLVDNNQSTPSLNLSNVRRDEEPWMMDLWWWRCVNLRCVWCVGRRALKLGKLAIYVSQEFLFFYFSLFKEKNSLSFSIVVKCVISHNVKWCGAMASRSNLLKSSFITSLVCNDAGARRASSSNVYASETLSTARDVTSSWAKSKMSVFQFISSYSPSYLLQHAPSRLLSTLSSRLTSAELETKASGE